MSSSFNPVHLAVPNLSVSYGADGTISLNSRDRLGPCPTNFTTYLRKWASDRPNAVFLAERSSSGDWITLSYQETHHQVRAVAQGLLDLGLEKGRPVLSLSTNGVDCALLQLAAAYVGFPFVPVSAQYGRSDRTDPRLLDILDRTRPGLVFLGSATKNVRTVDLVRKQVRAFVVASGPEGESPEGTAAFEDLKATLPTGAVDHAFDQSQKDDVARILFTSGSTGSPKGVPTTHGMLTSNVEAISQCWRFIENTPPVIVDWLPWSHGFAINHNFMLALRNGGSYYFSDGGARAELIERSLHNLAEVRPTIYFDTPEGFDLLLPLLEDNEALAKRFLSRLDALFYGGALLSQATWDGLQKLALQLRGTRLRFLSAWGMTETTCSVTCVHHSIERAGVIGFPVPGVTLKMVPAGGQMELRVKGPTVMSGYLGDPAQTAKVFDEDGFFRTGDAGRFDVANDPQSGIVFDGRLSENFKLSSGTWVRVSALREQLLQVLPAWVSDVVIFGEGQSAPAALVLPGKVKLPHKETALSQLEAAILRHNLACRGTAQSIQRAVVLTDAIGRENGEITEKGSLNQKALCRRFAKVIGLLFAEVGQGGPVIRFQSDLIGDPR